MFPLLVQEQLDFWPEKNARQRIWVGTNLVLSYASVLPKFCNIRIVFLEKLLLFFVFFFFWFVSTAADIYLLYMLFIWYR